MNAQIEGSLSIIFAATSAQTVQATGTSSATFTVPTVGGTFSPNAAPITPGDRTFLISSPFEIEVVQANLRSASYSLRSWLRTPDPKHSWTIDGIEISKGGGQMISTDQYYGMPNAHQLVVSGAAEALGNLTNAITFQVIAN